MQGISEGVGGVLRCDNGPTAGDEDHRLGEVKGGEDVVEVSHC